MHLFGGFVVAFIEYEDIKIWNISSFGFFYKLATVYFSSLRFPNFLVINSYLLLEFLAGLSNVMFVETFACYYVY